jgi:hypothetical protein
LRPLLLLDGLDINARREGKLKLLSLGSVVDLEGVEIPARADLELGGAALESGILDPHLLSILPASNLEEILDLSDLLGLMDGLVFSDWRFWVFFRIKLIKWKKNIDIYMIMYSPL